MAKKTTSKKKESKIFTATWFRVLLLIVGSVLTTLVLTFSVLAMIEIKNENVVNAPMYLVWVFICLGLTKFLYFFKKRTKISFIRCLLLLLINVSLGVLVIFAKYDLYIFSIAGGLFAISIILSRALILVEQHRVRDIIFNVIIMLGAACLAVGLFWRVESGDVAGVILVECIVISITAFIEVAIMAFAQMKVKVLFKIITKTYALEVLFGLLTMMIAFSLVLMVYEPQMSQFPDALWYCFAVVTTIGFGDIQAVTHIGRAISVFLGLYGIVVVAIITSIIVNFYNETKGKDDAEVLDEIKKDEENKK